MTMQEYLQALSPEEFAEHLIKAGADRVKCGLCSGCSLDYSWEREHGITDELRCASMVDEYFREAIRRIQEGQGKPDKKIDTPNCIDCENYIDQSGAGFCRVWNNFTAQNAYCCYYAEKS